MKRSIATLIGLLVASGLFSPLPLAAAARITILNIDGPDEGFNDPAPATPIGGNQGTTIGQQRLIAFQRAAHIWGEILNSPVEIVIRASFDPLTCSASSAVLGSAGATQIFSDFENAPRPDTWYPVALANKLAGFDLSPPSGTSDGADIRARFNSTIGDVNCLGGRGWYYGLDNKSPGGIDLIVVLLHELGHGLGFINFANRETGVYPLNTPDIVSHFTFDNTAGLYWVQMDDAQRISSSKNTDNLVFDGASSSSGAGEILDGPPALTINSPPAIAGTYQAGRALFGPKLTVSGITGPVVQAIDASNAEGQSTTDACSALTNASEVAGKIALVDRSTCDFGVQATNVRNAGGIGMIVASNQPGPTFVMGPFDPAFPITAVSITQADGNTIKAELPNGVSATLRADPTRLSGTDNRGRLRLFAPDPIQPGSSISHWDVSAFPNLLMEPSINSGLTHGVDLTSNFFEDIGWFVPLSISATSRATLLIDRDGDGLVDPGDTVRYAIEIRKGGDFDANDVRFDTTMDANVSLTAASITTSQGSIDPLDGAVSIHIGTLRNDDLVAIEFDVEVAQPLSTSIASISNRGAVSGSNFATVQTEGPAGGATVTAISHTPIRATKVGALAGDTDASGGLSRGDVIEYTVIIANFGVAPASDIVFDDLPDPNTTLQTGSVTSSRGTVTSGNAAGDRRVTATIGVIAPGESATIRFRVRIDDAPASVSVISNQGTVTGSTIVPILTDDPSSGGATDPTVMRFPGVRRRAIGR
ncbi:MAG TPA: PA domain-containing protein [Thermoanaerobaculia bacterium]|nr:PA domain-containing protein [Thermoanaerobaculia bacterium]